MSQKTLKELLRPPFYVSKDGIFADKNGWVLFRIGCPPILENAKFGDWVTVALNEKAERDLSEPLQWIYEYGEFLTCPKCKTIFNFYGKIDFDAYKHCPHCAQRLQPPEEE